MCLNEKHLGDQQRRQLKHTVLVINMYKASWLFGQSWMVNIEQHSASRKERNHSLLVLSATIYQRSPCLQAGKHNFRPHVILTEPICVNSGCMNLFKPDEKHASVHSTWWIRYFVRKWWSAGMVRTCGGDLMSDLEIVVWFSRHQAVQQTDMCEWRHREHAHCKMLHEETESVCQP